jgi:hypothetical protein
VNARRINGKGFPKFLWLHLNKNHAAALALVGWYLMTYNPLTTPLDKPLDWKPPLSQWTTLGSYDSAAQCREGSAKLAEAYRSQKTSDPRMAAVLMSTQCIASDDPRLKEK